MEAIMRNEFDILNDVKNNIENIKDIKLSDEEKQNINSRVMKKIKRNNKKSKSKSIAAAGLAIVLAGSLLLTNETVLAQINDIGRKIESFFQKEEDSWSKYKNDILQLSEDKGIKFMLHEVILDDEELYISASVDYSGFDRSTLKTDYEGNLNIIPSHEDPKFEAFLNGEKIEMTGAGGSYEYNEDGTVDMLLTLDVESPTLSDIYDIKLQIDSMEVQIPYKEHEFIQGNWNLDFRVNGDEITKDSRIVDVNETMEIEYKDIKIPLEIQELRITPISMRLKYKVGSEAWLNNMHIEFDFYDENNKKIDFVSQGGSDSGMSYKYMIDRDKSSIKVVPKIVRYNRFINKTVKFKDKAIIINID